MKYVFTVMVLLTVLTVGCNFSGCAGVESLDGGNDAGDSGDGGRDTGVNPDGSVQDGSFDAARDAGMDTGIDGSYDSGIPGCPPGVECIRPHLYDYDAGKPPENPLGPEYEYISTTGVQGMLKDGYFVFNVPTEESYIRIFIDGPICIFDIKKKATKCIPISDYKPKNAKRPGPGMMFVQDGHVGWKLEFSWNGPDYNSLIFQYDMKNNFITKVSICDDCDDSSRAGTGDMLVYASLEGEYFQLKKFNYSTGETNKLKTDLHPMSIQQAFFIKENKLLSLINDNTWLYYDLHSDKYSILDIYPYFISSISGGYGLADDGTNRDHNLYIVDLDTGKKELVYGYDYDAVWVSKYCTSNIVMWIEMPRDSELHKAVIYDLETKTKRYVIDKEGHYTVLCSGKDMVASPDWGSSLQRMYYLDLEKAGFIKDGHVVPEPVK